MPGARIASGDDSVPAGVLTVYVPGEGPLRSRLQLAELDYLIHSKAATAALAENYAGLPFEG